MARHFENAWLRSFEPTSFVILLARVQLIVGVVLIGVLLDLLMGGSMREALRYAIMDAPNQFIAMGAALLLACMALRFTLEAMLKLVAPDLLVWSDGTAQLARLLPRVVALAVALAAALPLFGLAFDSTALAGGDNRLLAAAAGAGLVAIGLIVAFVFKGPSVNDNAAAAKAPSVLLRAAIALVPLTIAIVFCGTVLGAWKADTGMAHDAVARYEDAGWLRVVAEGFALFAACLSARLAVAVFLDLVAPHLAAGTKQESAFHRWLPRAASLAVSLALVYELLAEHLPTLKQIGPSGLDGRVLWSTAVGYVLIGLLAGLIGARKMNPVHAPQGFPTFTKRWLRAAERLADLNRWWRWLFAAMIVAGIVLFLAFDNTSRVQTMQTIGPVAVLLLWGFAATLFFFPLAYLSHLVRVPLLLMVLLAGIAFSGFDLNDNHELRQVPVTAGAKPVPTYFGEDLDLPTWLESRRDWGAYDRYPIFLVATEGGGIRAAYFTASVLAALQERCPAFAAHTLAISSVSGGSVGAAVFASLAADHARNESAGCNLTGGPPGGFVSRARKVLATDLLSPLLGAALFPDALQRVLPVPIDEFDRSRAIEHALEMSWRAANQNCPACDADRMSKEVADLYSRSDPRKPVPHLFLNTTEAGTGKSIPYETVYVKSLATPYLGQAEIDEVGPTAGTGAQTIRLVSLQDRLNVDHVPLSAAAMLSARFPYLTPAGRIDGIGHYVDGGYFENSGTWLLSGVVQNLIGQKFAYRNPQNPALEAAVRNAVFITIVIQSSPCTRTTEFGRCDEDGSGGDADSTWNELLSPLRALLNTRDKRAEYSTEDLSALTALVEQLSAGETQVTDAPKDQTGCHHALCAVTLRFRNAPNVDVPLTWLLSSKARASMDDAVNRMEASDARAAIATDIASQQMEPGNHIVGSYGRILCVLDTRKGTPGCHP